ncbi:phospholipase A2 [Amycolatopsis suaedae]|uniref:Phospholipase n=1 Tax=Amycolatopsis suaedae TaxID=2510978 RepID=A0A4Q7J293_9PSEU|nr:phospholipase A2 [Amycolatopsis suaedae]RZQ60064.1 phospholipase [Amycolatopsis suaedae]
MTDAAKPRRARRTLSTSAWLLLVAVVVLGFGFVASRSPAPPAQGPPPADVAAAAAAAQAIIAPGTQPDALRRLPADFTRVTGVTPSSEPSRDGTVRAVHTGGGCSAPWGDDNTRWDYGVSCRSHDLGYDLLRYAAARGHPLGPEVREALDDRLSADMYAACDLNPMNSATACRMVAGLYSAGLVVNSWHQRWGPPVGEPIEPMLAGVAVIGCLLVVRLRGWLRVRRATPRPEKAPREPTAPTPGGRWAVIGVAAIAALVLGESALALARWAGADEAWLWPLTWVAQLAFVFFFAGGHANVAGWLATRDAGGGYRQYLAHRASWLLRPAVVFAVVTLLVPVAMELLHIPAGTSAVVMRIALHPLWLLGLYLLTMIATPAMHALHRKLPGHGLPVVAALAALLVGAEVAASLLPSPLPDQAATFVLALLAQQLALVHAERPRTSRRLLAGLAAAGLGTLAVAVAAGLIPTTLLGTPGTTPALAGPTLAVLLLGVGQLGLLGLVHVPLRRLAARTGLARAAATALRAPMSLYLAFLAAMLLLVALVYLPVDLPAIGDWLTRPRTLTGVAVLAVPAVLLFWWFERRRQPAAAPVGTAPAGRLGRPAVVLGAGYAALGVFGFALTGFSAKATVLGLEVDPIQNLLHLLLGVFLLQAVRTGTSGAVHTWVLTLLACVPPLMSATSSDVIDTPNLAVHSVTAAFAVAALLTSTFGGRMVTRTA